MNQQSPFGHCDLVIGHSLSQFYSAAVLERQCRQSTTAMQNAPSAYAIAAAQTYASLLDRLSMATRLIEVVTAKKIKNSTLKPSTNAWSTSRSRGFVSSQRSQPAWFSD